MKFAHDFLLTTALWQIPVEKERLEEDESKTVITLPASRPEAGHYSRNKFYFLINVGEPLQAEKPWSENHLMCR